MGKEHSSTHFVGCWHAHPACANEYIGELHAMLTAARQQLEDGLETPDDMEGAWSKSSRDLIAKIDETLNR